MRIEIRDAPFEPLALLAEYQASLMALAGHYGATSIFIGTMRDFNEGTGVSRLMLEHYPGMTERQLEKIVQQAMQEWPLLDALVIHRVGELYPDDSIVLIAVWSAHRAVAFEGCRFIVEALKNQAPFWKKETVADGERWVMHNTAG